MPDKKISELTSLVTTQSGDLVLVIDDPTGTPTSKQVTIKNFFGAIAANAVFSANLTVTGNNATFSGSNTVFNANVNIRAKMIVSDVQVANSKIRLFEQLTPANSTIKILPGNLFADNNFIYFAPANNNLKRATLASF